MEKITRVSLTDWLNFLEGGLEKSEKINFLYNSGKFREDKESTESKELRKEVCYENAYCA